MKKGFENIICVGVLTLFLFSCQKETIELPESNNPVFKTDLTFDEEELKLTAGDDGYFMYTMTKSTNGVKTYCGELSDGETTIEIGFYEGKLDFNGSSFLNQLNSIDKFSFNENKPLAILDYHSFPNDENISDVQWIVNGQIFNDKVVINEPGNYSVCAFVTFLDNDVQQLCGNIILGYERSANAQINHYIGANGLLTAWIGNVQGVVSEVKWELNGETISNSPELHIDIDSMRYELSALIQFENGSQRKKTIIVDGAHENKFIVDLSMFEKELTPVNDQDYNLFVRIIRDGHEYSSEYTDNSNSSISITNVEYFGLNSNGKKAYKIQATIDCMVAISKQDGIPLSGNVEFGVEIDE